MKRDRVAMASFQELTPELIVLVLAASLNAKAVERMQFKLYAAHRRISRVCRQQRAYFETAYPEAAVRHLFGAALTGLLPTTRGDWHKVDHAQLADLFAAAAGEACHAQWLWREVAQSASGWCHAFIDSVNGLPVPWQRSYEDDREPQRLVFLANSEIQAIQRNDDLKRIADSACTLPPPEILGLLSAMIRLYRFRYAGRIEAEPCSGAHTLGRVMIYQPAAEDAPESSPGAYAIPLQAPAQGTIDACRLTRLADLLLSATPINIDNGHLYVVHNLTQRCDYSQPGRTHRYYDMSDVPTRLSASRLFQYAVERVGASL